MPARPRASAFLFPPSAKRVVLALAAMAALGFALARPADANTTFFYASSVNAAFAPTLPTNPPSFGAAVLGLGPGAGAGSLTFTPNSGTGPIDGSLPGGADINFATITFNGGSDSTVAAFAVNFNFLVTFTDEASPFSGTVNITGQIAGSAQGGDRPAINSTITNYAVSPSSLEIGEGAGKAIYTVSVGPAVGPGSFFDGVLQANIRVVPIPEPTSAVLVGLGLLALRRRPRSVQ